MTAIKNLAAAVHKRTMPFSRTQPESAIASLDAALRSLGIRVGSTPAPREPADIELTLSLAVEQALPRDYRLLAVLVTWLEMHHARVNVPRLGRVVKGNAAGNPLVFAFWAAIGHWLGARDTRWLAMKRLYVGKRLDLDDAEITALQLQRVGADPRFAGSPLRVHTRFLRSRTADVDTREQLAARHPLYRKRLELGSQLSRRCLVRARPRSASNSGTDSAQSRLLLRDRTLGCRRLSLVAALALKTTTVTLQELTVL